MVRFILYTLLLIIVISIVKSVIGAVMKSFGDFAGRPDALRGRGRQPGAQLGGDLHRDPICGTFVAESTAFQRRLGSQTFYYCSNTCREKHALAAK
jgi:YHS domain-containing protein